MTALVAVYVAAIVAGAACLEWPTAAGTRNQNRYGKQLAQKQNRYGNVQPAWPTGGASRAGGGWAAYGGNIMRHYPVSINRYQTMVVGGGGGGGRRRPNALSDDYYDADAPGPYDPRPYDRMDYAVVRYPSYGVAGGYYDPVSADLASAYDAAEDDDDDDGVGDVLMYDDAAAASAVSPYYPPINRYPVPPPPPPLNRYEPARHPTDKIHKFRKVFMSNPVSPSNAFKSTKERQLYDFWESLINGDLDGVERQPDGADDGSRPHPRRTDWPQQQPETAAASQLYQHLPLVFQQLQQKQRLQQQRQQLQQQQQQQQQQRPQPQPQPQQDAQQLRQRPAEQRAPPAPSLASSAATSSASSFSSSSSSSSSIPRGNLYKQWANGSPLIKRSSAIPPNAPSPSDDVLQLERLRANAPSTTAATRPAAADSGQREYVLPRPADEKSGFESLLEVIAEGGIRDNVDENAATAYRKLRQEVKVNKKRSFVSDETSLAAQLGALRKN